SADPSAPLGLGLHLGDVHGRHMHLEQLLDRLADLGLVRTRMHPERVLPVRNQAVALLGDNGRDQDLVGVQTHCALLTTVSSAFSDTSRERAHTTAATSSRSGVVTATRPRFRNDLA